jgi:iron(III) transport system substrate-binding protein
MKKKPLVSSLPLILILALSYSPVVAEPNPEWVEGAKKEGQLEAWAHTWNKGEVVEEPFKRKYPFLNVRVWDGRSTDIVAKMVQEAQAGKFTPDIVTLESLTMKVVLENGLLRQYDWPARVVKWSYQPNHRFWVSPVAALRVPTYNKRFISSGDAPKSWEDLVNSRWKGKSILSTAGSNVPLLFADLWKRKDGTLDWEKSFSFWNEVVTVTQPAVRQGFTPPNELHVAGEYPLFLINVLNTAFRYIANGAPIGIVPVKKTVGSSWGLAMPKNVRHPNAAHLFMDYLISPEGLLNYAEANDVPVFDPEVALKASPNIKLKELNIDWYSVDVESRSAEEVKKASSWWVKTLRRGGNR